MDVETNSTRTELVARLKDILQQDLLLDVDSDSISENDGLQSTLGLDSVSFVELRVACERKFGIEISDDEFNPKNFRSLAALANFIDGRSSKAE